MQCNEPFYVGNGSLCAQDSDRDKLSDQIVSICNQYNHINILCAFVQDTCPLIFNLNNDPIVCDSETPGR